MQTNSFPLQRPQEFEQRTRVLVIDDDRSVGLAIQALLSHQGCDTTLVQDGDAGIELFEATKFDATIVDIFMPGTDGLKIIKSLRERRFGSPIIAMSGFRFRNSLAPHLDFLGMAAELGAIWCLRKPFTPQQLVVAINACLPVPLSAADLESAQTDARGPSQ